MTGTVGLIWAQGNDRQIGVGGALPWHLPEDLAHFREVTAGATVVMGRATWESLPQAYRPLPGRRNVVLSRDPDYRAEGADVVSSLSQALDGDVWVIGGGAVYAAAMGTADELVVTHVDSCVPGDTFAPVIGPEWGAGPSPWLTSASGLRYRFSRYTHTS